MLFLISLNLKILPKCLPFFYDLKKGNNIQCRQKFDTKVCAGMMVSISCPSGDGQYTKMGEVSTNFMGNYAMRFGGAPDLSGCYTQVSGNGQGCGAVAGAAQNPRLMFRMFDMEMYSVDPLLSQPAQPMSLCPRAANNPVSSPPQNTILPPPTPPTQSFSFPPPAISPPSFRLPPMPKWPPLPTLPPMPPMPFFQASACPYQ